MRIAKIMFIFLNRIKEWIWGAYWFTRWLQYKVKFHNYCIPYSEEEASRPMVILANGPSLKDDFPAVYKRINETGASIMVVNHFALTKDFVQLKPHYYLIADRVFFRDKLDEKSSSVYKALNEVVDWPLNFIIPIHEKSFIENRVSNPNINIIPLCVLPYMGPTKYKYKVYKKGISVPSFVNISVMAIYYALNKGAKMIYLYGVDHTFLREIAVDDDNMLCSFDHHFYGSEKRQLPPTIEGKPLKMADFVYDKYLTFVEHNNMRGYADYLGATIVNCTRCSCIDSYIRLTQFEN